MSRKLKEILKHDFSDEELNAVVGSYDVVGDMAIIIVPELLVAREKEIANAILQINKKIRVVAKRAGHYGGEFRTIDLEIIAGDSKNEVLVKEFGVRLLFDPQAVYFSARSGNERKRIASLVQRGEEVLVLFSGIGPFPLIISSYSRAKSIVGIEKNRVAYKYAEKNLQLNKKLNNITFYLGDVVDVVPKIKKNFDRVLMTLPTRGDGFLPIALQTLKVGGWLHFYDMQHVDLFDYSVEKVVDAAQNLQRKVVSSTITKCGHCAPRTYRVCVDARIY